MGRGYLVLVAALAVLAVFLAATYIALLGAEARGEELSGELSRARREIEELRSENERLRARLEEALRRAESLEELLSPRILCLDGRLNVSVSTSIEGEYIVYNVSIGVKPGLPPGIPVVLVLAQIGGDVDRAWVYLYSAGSPGHPAFKLPRGEVTMLETFLYAAPAAATAGPVYVAAPPDVEVGVLSVKMAGEGGKACVEVSFPASRRAGGKKVYYLLVAKARPGEPSRLWSHRLLLLGPSETLVKIGTICSAPGEKIVLAVLPVPG